MNATPVLLKNHYLPSPTEGLSSTDEDHVGLVPPGPALSEGEASDTATIFETAFSEVSLDLTFSFSTQNSPAASTVELPLSDAPSQIQLPSLCVPSSSTSVEATPSIHTLPRTRSFASQLTPLSPLIKTKKKFKSAKFSSDQSSILRGSWPAIKYVGRGTPVDRSRRKEWSGISTENVGEDGLLFSDARAISLASRSPRRSSSSDWDFLNAGLPGLSVSGSPRSGGRSISIHHPVAEEEEDGGLDQQDRVPPLPKIEIQLENETEDWASVMETVLSSADKGREGTVNVPNVISIAEIEEETPEEMQPEKNLDEEPGKLHSELQFDLNIDKALDLGFSPAVDGGTLFTLAAITDSNDSNLTIRRTTTVSTRSQYSTPSEGPSDDRPAVVLPVETPTNLQDKKSPTTPAFRNVRSTNSVKADARVTTTRSLKVDEGLPWWRKALGRLKRAQALLRPHRSIC